MVRAPMPIARGAVTFARFRSESGAPPRDARRWLTRGLDRGAFEPIDVERGEDDRSAGFVSPEDRDSTDFESGTLERGRALFAFRIDTIRVKASAVRPELERWSAAFASEHRRPPTRGEKATAKDEIRHRLRKRQPPTTRVLDVSWSLDAGELQIWAASRKAVEEVAVAIEAAFEVKLAPLSAGAQAVRADVAESALAPTAELLGLSREEVRRGEA